MIVGSTIFLFPSLPISSFGGHAEFTWFLDSSNAVRFGTSLTGSLFCGIRLNSGLLALDEPINSPDPVLMFAILLFIVEFTFFSCTNIVVPLVLFTSLETNCDETLAEGTLVSTGVPPIHLGLIE